MRKGWEYKKLGEVGQIVTGSTPSTKDESNYSPREYCFVKPSDLPSQGIADIEETEYFVSQVGLSKSRVLPAGSVLVSCIGSIGKIGILTKEACSNQQINAIIPQDETDSRFIAYSLYAQRFVFESIANAPVVPIINKTDFSKIRIGIPPKSTQLAIVSELDKINELIRLKKEQLKDFDNLAQSLFYEMFGDPVENEKGWDVKKLGDVSIYPNKRIQVSELNPQDYVGVENLQKNRAGIVFSDKIPNTDSAIAFSPNDILIGNIRPYLKKIWLADKSGGASGDVVIIRICTNDLQPMYLYKVLASDQFFEYDNTYTKGAKMPRGDKNAIAKFIVPLPPFSLQRLFAQRIEQIGREKSEVQKSIQDLETLLASRMQYWFE